MTALLVNAIFVVWSNTDPKLRHLSVRATFRGGRDRPAYSTFLMGYDLGYESNHVRSIDDAAPSSRLPTGQEQALLSHMATRNARAQALLEGFFERSLKRSRLPHTPLLLNTLTFGEDSFPMRPNRWLSDAYLPLVARLFNVPGRPFGGLFLHWSPEGRLMSVRDDSLQYRRKAGAPAASTTAVATAAASTGRRPTSRALPPKLAAQLVDMSRGIMDSDTAYRYFALRYEPAVAADLRHDLVFLGQEGRKLGLALLRVLA